MFLKVTDGCLFDFEEIFVQSYIKGYKQQFMSEASANMATVFDAFIFSNRNRNCYMHSRELCPIILLINPGFKDCC